jgi:ATP phosphoribosyltransferase regulatory subunit HisZ
MASQMNSQVETFTVLFQKLKRTRCVAFGLGLGSSSLADLDLTRCRAPRTEEERLTAALDLKDYVRVTLELAVASAGCSLTGRVVRPPEVRRRVLGRGEVQDSLVRDRQGALCAAA